MSQQDDQSSTATATSGARDAGAVAPVDARRQRHGTPERRREQRRSPAPISFASSIQTSASSTDRCGCGTRRAIALSLPYCCGLRRGGAEHGARHRLACRSVCSAVLLSASVPARRRRRARRLPAISSPATAAAAHAASRRPAPLRRNPRRGIAIDVPEHGAAGAGKAEHHDQRLPSTIDQTHGAASVPRLASRIISLPMKPESGGRPTSRSRRGRTARPAGSGSRSAAAGTSRSARAAAPPATRSTSRNSAAPHSVLWTR